jgi:hypothetical protein
MMQFIKNLDNKLGKMIDQMDGALNAPVNQCLTGEVFRDGDNHHFYVNHTPHQREIEVDITCDNEIHVETNVRSTQSTKLVQSTTRA